MAITSGFFQSVGGDRKYSADDFNRIFEGVLSDGVFANVGDRFTVSVTSARQVSVASGRAWLSNHWVRNDGPVYVSVPAAASTQARIDAIALVLDVRESSRAASIQRIAGTPGTVGVRPTVTSTSTVTRIPLAYVSVYGSDALSSASVTNVVGTAQAPYVTAPLERTSLDSYLGDIRSSFESWWNSIKDSVANQNQGLEGLATLTNRVQAVENTLNTVTGSPAISSNTNPVANGTALAKNGIYRGSNLGSVSSYMTTIRSGQFQNMYVGDYFVAGNQTWRIAGFDLLYGMGQSASSYINTHHIVLVPDFGVGSPAYDNLRQFHTQENIANVGVLNSSLNAYVTPGTGIHADILSRCISFPMLYAAGVSNTGEHSLQWGTATAALMTPYQIFGSTQARNATYVDMRHMYQNQFPLFRLAPTYIGLANAAGKDKRYWTRAMVDTIRVNVVEGTGLSSYVPPNQSHVVRPFVLVG